MTQKTYYVSFSVYYQGFYDSSIFNNRTDSVMDPAGFQLDVLFSNWLNSDWTQEHCSWSNFVNIKLKTLKELIGITRERDYTLNAKEDFPYTVMESYDGFVTNVTNITQVILNRRKSSGI